ncbi:hypothetical protein C4D60_Mb07t04830 [Musa balbisiana]|uniref:2-methoxy-6-polyprenyl-1,4-benzoquinol methylase, mitochondrial n=1 Tax=Musa balbisiana TaxID=52838 RepID=A0A4S8JFJ0_MUSBA|nr:hypothetical protein C4D60_Mb07t04830 [Musa balbisiana]
MVCSHGMILVNFYLILDSKGEWQEPIHGIAKKHVQTSQQLVTKLGPFPGMKHLDVAGGTGDIAFRVLESIRSVSRRAMQDGFAETEEQTQIYICDINPNMLNIGKKRAIERGFAEDRYLHWVEGDAEALSFEDESMDGYTIGFGIRNVTHIEKALAEAYSYDYYSFSVIPAVGELVAGDRESYQYLVESIRRFPNQDAFGRMIVDAGFQKVEYENLVGGVVAIHSGLKL